MHSSLVKGLPLSRFYAFLLDRPPQRNSSTCSSTYLNFFYSVFKYETINILAFPLSLDKIRVRHNRPHWGFSFSVITFTCSCRNLFFSNVSLQPSPFLLPLCEIQIFHERARRKVSDRLSKKVSASHNAGEGHTSRLILWLIFEIIKFYVNVYFTISFCLLFQVQSIPWD